MLINSKDHLLIEPLDAFALLPEAMLLRIFFFVRELADTVLLAAIPPAEVFTTIRPGVVTETGLLIIEELTFVNDAIDVVVDAIARHVVLVPLAEVFAAICPDILTNAADLVVEPVAVVEGTVGPVVLTKAVLHAELVGSFVSGAIGPSLHSLSMLEIVFPLAHKGSTFFIN